MRVRLTRTSLRGPLDRDLRRLRPRQRRQPDVLSGLRPPPEGGSACVPPTPPAGLPKVDLPGRARPSRRARSPRPPPPARCPRLRRGRRRRSFSFVAGGRRAARAAAPADARRATASGPPPTPRPTEPPPARPRPQETATCRVVRRRRTRRSTASASRAAGRSRAAPRRTGGTRPARTAPGARAVDALRAQRRRLPTAQEDCRRAGGQHRVGRRGAGEAHRVLALPRALRGGHALLQVLRRAARRGAAPPKRAPTRRRRASARPAPDRSPLRPGASRPAPRPASDEPTGRRRAGAIVPAPPPTPARFDRPSTAPAARQARPPPRASRSSSRMAREGRSFDLAEGQSTSAGARATSSGGRPVRLAAPRAPLARGRRRGSSGTWLDERRLRAPSQAAPSSRRRLASPGAGGVTVSDRERRGARARPGDAAWHHAVRVAGDSAAGAARASAPSRGSIRDVYHCSATRRSSGGRSGTSSSRPTRSSRAGTPPSDETP